MARGAEWAAKGAAKQVAEAERESGMTLHAKELTFLSDKELLERLSGVQPGSSLSYTIKVKLERRSLVAQMVASKAQIRAAEAAKAAALRTQRSAIVIAASVVLLVVMQIVGLFI